MNRTTSSIIILILLWHLNANCFVSEDVCQLSEQRTIFYDECLERYDREKDSDRWTMLANRQINYIVLPYQTGKTVGMDNEECSSSMTDYREITVTDPYAGYPLENAVIEIKLKNQTYQKYEYDFIKNFYYLITLPICSDETYDIKISDPSHEPTVNKDIKFSIGLQNKPSTYVLKQLKPKPLEITKYQVDVRPIFIRNQKKKTALTYDSSIKAFIKCNKNKQLLNMKSITPPYIECSEPFMNLTITSNKFEKHTEKIYLKNDTSKITIEPKLSLTKPGLFILINPSDDFKKGYVKKHINSFAYFKERILTKMIEGYYSKTSMINIYSKNYKEQPDVIFENFHDLHWDEFIKSEKWKLLPIKILDEIKIFNESIDINTIMNIPISFFNLNNYTFPKQSKRGIILLILSDAPIYKLNVIDEREKKNVKKQYSRLNDTLEKNNIATLVIFISTEEKKIIVELSNLVCIRYNFKLENKNQFSNMFIEVQNKLDILRQ